MVRPVMNISSLADAMPPPNRNGLLLACKVTMDAMTGCLAEAVAAEGATVNAIPPERSAAQNWKPVDS